MRRLRRSSTPGRTRGVPGNALLRRIAGARRETGAIAIVMAVVLVAVLIPLAFFGASTYVKSGLAGELQRAADSGATAGASAIPLADPTALKTLLADVTHPAEHVSEVTSALVDDMLGDCKGGDGSGTCPPDPLVRATQTCEQSIVASRTDGFGAPYAKKVAADWTSVQAADNPDGEHRSVLSAHAGAQTTAHCAAWYGTSPLLANLLTCIKGVPDAATGLINSLVSATPLSGLDDALLAPLLKVVTNLVDVLLNSLLDLHKGIGKILQDAAPAGLLGALLPSLLTPKVIVQSAWYERGNGGGLGGAASNLDPTAKSQSMMTRDAKAKRSFRNLVVVPTLPVGGHTTRGLLGALGNLVCSIPVLNILCGLFAPKVEKPPVTRPGDSPTLDLNPTLYQAGHYVDHLLTHVNSIVGTLADKLHLPGECTGILDDVQGDLSEIVAPPIGHEDQLVPKVQDVLKGAVEHARPVLFLEMPTDVTSTLRVPFLSFVPVCLQSVSGDITSTAGLQVKYTVQDLYHPKAHPVTPVGGTVQCTLDAPSLFTGRLVS